MQAEDARRSTRIGAALAAAALAAYAATAAMVPLDNNDIWIHLTTGRLILDEGAVPRSDVYSFTAAGNRYVAHEWLAAVLYAAAERWGGIPAVEVVGKMAPTLALLAALGAAALAARAPAGIALPVAVLPLTLLRRRVLARPELLALPLLLAALALLWRDREASHRGRRTRAVFWLVPLEALWANLHGSFPLGIALVLVFAFAEAADVWLPGDDARARAARGLGIAGGLVAAGWLATLEPRAFAIPASAGVLAATALFGWRAQPALFRQPPGAGSQGVLRLLGLAAAMTAAVALNPRGVAIYAFPFEFTAAQNAITNTVSEWQPLLDSRYMADSLQLVAYGSFLAAGFATLALGARRGSLGRLEVALFLALVLLPLRHLRWISLSGLAATPALASLLAAARDSAPDARGARRAAGAAAGALAIACAALALVSVWRAPPDFWLRAAWALSSVAAAAALALAWRPSLPLGAGTAAAGGVAILGAAIAAGPGIPEVAGIPARVWSGSGDGPGFGPSRQAASATDLLREAGVEGRLFTEYEWAGYAIHELWPRVTVYLDSRSEVYGEALLLAHREVKNRPQRAREAIDRYGIDLVLVRQRPYPAIAIRNRGILGAIEADPRWGLVFLDDDSRLYARGDARASLPPAFERFAPQRFDPADPRLADPALQAEIREAVARAPHSAFLRFALALSLRTQGRPREALAELEAGWAANPHYPAGAQLAGEIEASRGRAEAARVWFARALALAPGWVRARASLEALPPAAP